MAIALAAALGAQEDKSLLAVIRDDTRGQKLREARSGLAAGKTAHAIDLLIDCLQSSPSAVIGRGSGRFVGIREAARNEIARLSTATFARYEQAIGTAGDVRLREALLHRDPDYIARVAIDCPLTSSARAARRIAGDRFLEQGRVVRALQEFSLAGMDSPVLVARRLICRALLGLPVKMPLLPPGTRLPLGELHLPADVWLRRVRDFERIAYGADYWPAYGGGLDGARLASTPDHPTAELWSRSIESLVEVDDEYSHNVHAVTDGERVFVATGTKLYGFGLEPGTVSWSSASYLAGESSWEQEAFLGTVSPHMAHSAALGAMDGRRVAVASLQVPVKPKYTQESHWWGRRGSTRMPVRRLHGFDARTGELLWRHYTGDEDRPDPLAHEADALDVCGPPLVIDDTVYVFARRDLGGIALYLGAFDLASGRQRWSTLICTSQIESNRHGNPYQEFAASPLAYDAGILYGATNLGACFALRADDGSIRWMHSYTIVPLPAPSRRRPRLRPIYWNNSAPALSEDVAIFTPVDSMNALALDVRTGKQRWDVPFELWEEASQKSFEFAWLLGASRGYAWFSGQGICKVKLRGEGAGVPIFVADPQAPDRDDEIREVPRGLLTEEHLLHVSPSAGLVVLDYAGRRVTEGVPTWGSRRTGNLIATRGALVFARPGRIRAARAAK